MYNMLYNIMNFQSAKQFKKKIFMSLQTSVKFKYFKTQNNISPFLWTEYYFL